MGWDKLCSRVKCRTVISMLVFWGQIQSYMMRASLSLIIVAMVKKQRLSGTSVEDQGESCITQIGNGTLTGGKPAGTEAEEGELEWDTVTIGLVLSSFNWGYMCSQIIGGRMSELYGSKKVYGAGITIPAFLVLLHPVAARIDYKLFIALRALMGVFNGVTWPAMHAITARWVPETERSSFIAQTYFGSTFGLCFTFPMCGFIIASYGWAACFYVISGITLTWSIFWWTIIYNTPEEHPRISQEELDLLKTLKISKTKLRVPWTQILKSWPLWGTLITDCCNTWGIVTLASFGPTYLKTMLGLDIKTNGIVSGLPMISRYLGGVCFSRLSDWLIRTNRIRMMTSRRLFNTLSQVGPAVGMVLMVYVGCSYQAVTGLKIVAMFLNGAISSGHFSSGVDLAPNFAGTLFGITNTVSGGAVGALSPIANSHMLKGPPSWSAWEGVFWTAAAIYATGNCFYVLLIKVEAQPWNFPEESGPESGAEQARKQVETNKNTEQGDEEN